MPLVPACQLHHPLRGSPAPQSQVTRGSVTLPGSIQQGLQASTLMICMARNGPQTSTQIPAAAGPKSQTWCSAAACPECFYGPGGCTGHSDQYDFGGSLIIGHKHGLKWWFRPQASMWPLVIDINTDPGCGRATDTHVALSSSSVLEDTTAPIRQILCQSTLLNVLNERRM